MLLHIPMYTILFLCRKRTRTTPGRPAWQTANMLSRFSYICSFRKRMCWHRKRTQTARGRPAWRTQGRPARRTPPCRTAAAPPRCRCSLGRWQAHSRRPVINQQAHISEVVPFKSEMEAWTVPRDPTESNGSRSESSGTIHKYPRTH